MTQIIHIKATSPQGEHDLHIEFQPGSSFSDLDVSARDLLIQKDISEDEAYRYDLQVISVSDKPRCSLCGKEISPKTAHVHHDRLIGDECCWDERLRMT